MSSAADASLTGMEANPVILRHSLSVDGYGAVPSGAPEDVLVEHDEDQEIGPSGMPVPGWSRRSEGQPLRA